MNKHSPNDQQQKPPRTQQEQLQRLLLILVLIIFAMFGFGYALVPLYNTFCKLTGLNGKSGGPVALSTAKIDTHRSITVEFLTTNNANLAHCKFYPLVKKLVVHPSQNARVAFFVENNSPSTITVQAIPSITPSEAAKYFRKTECFCFTRQTLKAGQALDMPMIFHLDSALPKNIKVVTLSYTMFDVTGSGVRK